MLVTGGAGFIGQRLVRALAESGAVVASLDITSLSSPTDGISFYLCSLLDAVGLENCFSAFSPQLVVHLAARTDLDETRDILGYSANIEGVTNLLACVARHDSVDRVIVTSSQLVCKVGHVPISEYEYCPDTLYGASKVQTERITRDMDGGGKDWVLLRPTTIWGPGMRAHYVRFFKAVEKGRYFHVGHKTLLKSYGFIDNCVHQYIRLMQAPRHQIRSRVFYIADYEPIDLRAWADAFQEAMGARPIPTVPKTVARVLAAGGDLSNMLGWKSFPFNSFRLRNILTEYVFDMKPTEAVCGPLPTSVSEGVAKTVEWFKDRLV